MAPFFVLLAVVATAATWRSRASTIPETPLIDRTAEPGRPFEGTTLDCSASGSRVVEDRLAVVEFAERRSIADPCDARFASEQPLDATCRAIWLASVLDPLDLWLDAMTPENRRRASGVVDRALGAAVTNPDPELAEETAALERIRVANAEITTILDVAEPDHARLATWITDRSGPDVIEPLRALERACNRRR